jgi:hypothetical protein
MNKSWSRILLVGGGMLLVTAMSRPSFALESLDNLPAQIKCTITTDELAVRCDEVVLQNLVECDAQLEAESELAGPSSSCDQQAQGALRKCELTQTLGGLKCLLGGTAALQ